ncbi:YheC/YheD family protein [Legionella jordanis]|uniref:Tubulin-tyrosine ligase family protein n=1 Tax=Legionella jordanis TaxID=456 RepID=A0A0W0VDD5_9GAMM|nr:YheC/YheD family protein [Legionella jordanis]KTD18090.1 Tubulin-tyrosine ligase family protein [Legionella jordanis]VEH13818.1 Tubulin-tyrosine ligase family [Legionella jordanis]
MKGLSWSGQTIKYFALDPKKSPTYFNLHRHLQALGWLPCTFNWQASFSERNFEFNTAASQCLEYKHLLAQLLKKYNLPFSPVTYCIDDGNWPNILAQIAEEHYRCEYGYQDEKANLTWILKPSLLNNGQQIKIFTRLSQLERHFLSADRLGGEHVLQEYVAKPHLLRPPQGHKYSIRMFVVLTNYTGCYLYPFGYFNVALQPFQTGEFQDLRSHLTNEHLLGSESNVVQIPTERFDFFPKLYPQIKGQVTEILKALKREYRHAFDCQKNPALAIFGFDFLVDEEQRLWLLEANHGPCFPREDNHPLQTHLYDNFWQALIQGFVISIANRQQETGKELFDFISMN